MNLVIITVVLSFVAYASIFHQVGFEITRVNGFTLSESTHDEVINLMKMKRKLLLSCKGERMSTCILTIITCCYSCRDVARAKVSLNVLYNLSHGLHAEGTHVR